MTEKLDNEHATDPIKQTHNKREILYKKSKIAFEEFKKINSTNKIKFVVAGGVAATKEFEKS